MESDPKYTSLSTNKWSIFKPDQRLKRRGLLIVGEGLDGCGKTTIMQKLVPHLQTHGQDAVLSSWNEVSELYNLMMRRSSTGDLNREMRSIFGAADLVARNHYVIIPALHQGKVVLLTKYVVSALAHALIRGVDRGFVSRLYDFALKPDLTIYFDVPPEVALERKLRSGIIGFWEAGIDQAINVPLAESLRRYQERALSQDFINQSFLTFQRRLKLIYEKELRGRALFIDASKRPECVLKEATRAVDKVMYKGKRECLKLLAT
jgi:dTMP kinase